MLMIAVDLNSAQAQIELTIDLLTVATRTMAQAQQISALVLKAQAEGRDRLTDEEWAQIRAADDAARAVLVTAIGGGQ
ncbi:MAG: hypothetical protein AB7L76_19165 [Burkholderiaceae bacterium]